MRISGSSTIFAVLASAGLAAALPACSSNSGTPCSCPNGTSYQESVTFEVIGAKASDVKALISDFYDTAWIGILPIATEGPDDQPGSIRTVVVPTAVGTYTFKETLNELQSDPDGSFISRVEMTPSTVPLEYASGNGSFSGYWITIKSESVFYDETAVTWSIYACSTGHSQNFAAFHEKALSNATSVLQKEGKVLGVDLKPVSIQAF